MDKNQILITIIIVIYFAITVVIGLLSGRKTKSAASFTGVALSTFAIVCASTGEWLGGTATTGVSEYGFLYGLSGWWYTIANGIGVLFLGLLFAKLFRSLETGTVPGIIEKFFGVNARTVSCVILTIVMLAVGLSQMIAAGKLGENLLGIVNYTGVTSIEALIGTAVTTGAAGSIKKVSGYNSNADIVIELNAVDDKILDGMMITVAGATVNTGANGTFPVRKLNDREILLKGAAYTGAESSTATMTFTVKHSGFKSVEEGVDAALEAKADIVVICSSDDEYAEYAIPAFKYLNGRAMFVVAGAPACMEDLKAAGIENYIHVKCNVLETLKEYNQKLGI